MIAKDLIRLARTPGPCSDPYEMEASSTPRMILSFDMASNFPLNDIKRAWLVYSCCLLVSSLRSSLVNYRSLLLLEMIKNYYNSMVVLLMDTLASIQPSRIRELRPGPAVVRVHYGSYLQLVEALYSCSRY